ncbi:tetratricopeptide repeat protein [Phenylobacterium sp.]|uniref:tetratricopeptide repeat protein n=1 Tax=Phenylobacterium sp. TaxID=1871053 RepID=UPI0035B3B6CA|nr:tetratricopeptide repeat protein [Pseudomonadota bacterium]
MFKGVLLAMMALAMLAFATTAEGAVSVFGGGLAQDCADAAIRGEDDPKFQDSCTLALETELLDPRDRAGTFVNRGVLKLRRSAFSDAARDFDFAVRLQPEMGEAYVNRGAASIGRKRYAEGLSDINRSLELGVSEPEKAYYNRALAHEGLDDPKSAYFDYQKALEIAPDWDAPRQQLSRFTVSRR